MNNYLMIVLVVVAPSLFWGAYHYYKDRHQPEPIRNLLLTYALGILAGFLGLHAYTALGWVGLRYDAYLLAETNKWGLFLYCVLVIGVIEELVKFIPFWLIGMRLHHFDEPIDGIIYASFVALGFASYENIYYLLNMDGWEAVGRAFASPMVHIMFASIWGYTCSRAHMNNRPVLPAAILGLAIASVGHGIYDFVAIGFSYLAHFIPPVIILVIWIWRMHLIRRLQQYFLQHKGNSNGNDT